MTASDFDEPVQTDEPDPQTTEEPGLPVPSEPLSGFVTWAVASLLVLGYVAFGSIPAVRYTYDAFLQRLFVNRGRESILHLWTYQIEHLPSIGAELLVQTAFVAAIAIFVAGLIVALWVLLVSPAADAIDED